MRPAKTVKKNPPRTTDIDTEPSAGWRSWFIDGLLHLRLRVRPRPKSVDFHDAENRQRPCRMIMQHVKEPFRVRLKLLGAVDTRRYPRTENRVWSGLEDHEERGSMIRRQALVDPTVTRSTIRADVGVAIVPQIIPRHLAEANLKSKRPFRALPLTPEHRQLRLQWCQARSMKNVTDWQKVEFSDESRFVLGTDDNCVSVWRCPGDRYNSPPPLFYITLPAQLV
ncbi:transposable element Tcb2 transposase [Trichonephila clavipes]|nr:transposable element Tcb2 transposase [Trichonephila clavipes]